MKKFDLKKAILENKATFHSSLREGDLMKSVGKGLEYEATEEMIRDYASSLLNNLKNSNHQFDDVEDYFDFYLRNPKDLPEPMDYNFFRNNYDDILSLAMTGLDEGKKSKKYYKDAEADDAEHIKALEKDMKDDKKASKKLKEDMSRYFTSPPKTPTTLVDRIIYMYPKMKWLKDELPGWFTFQDVKETLEDAGYGKVYDEFMGGDMGGRMTDLNETNTKMKKSDLKAKIKEMIVAEMDGPAVEDAQYDFLAELEGMLDESPINDPRTAQIIQMLRDMDVDGETMEYILRQVGMDDQIANQLVNYPAEYAASLKEADETEKDTAEVDTTDVAVDDTETVTTSTEVEVDPNVKAVQDALTQAQVAAQKLGDKKLTDQIGNTITFFTREHVVEKPKTAVAEIESLKERLLLQKKAGIITEAQYQKKVKEAETSDVSPEQAVDKAMDLVPKLEKSPELDKLADKIAKDPNLLKQLEKALAQGGIMMNEELEKLDNSDLEKLALNLAKKADKLNETISSNPEEDTSSAGLGMLAFAGGGTLGASFSSAIAAAIPAIGTVFAGPAVLGALAGVGLFLLARKVYLKMNPDA